jgi:glycosyltransferase involved in cell wall biosynthesis
MQRQLESRGFRNIARWSRGVDSELFRPRDKQFLDLPRPVWLFLGRVAVEKGIEDFLALDLPGTKLVIGDGPARGHLEHAYPDAVFVGYKHGEDLARHVAAGDVFVFPSRTDTFGLVLLEAMACGLPVAAYPVTGPIDVILDGVTGPWTPTSIRAALRALSLDPATCRKHALKFSWAACTHQFRSALVGVPAREVLAEPFAG